MWHTWMWQSFLSLLRRLCVSEEGRDIIEFPLDWLVDGDKLKTQPTDLIHGKYMYIECGLGVGKRL